MGLAWRRLAVAGVGEEQGHDHVTMVYWKGEQFWLGKLLEHPEVMTQGETIEELEEHLRDAYRLLILDDVPADAQVKALVI